MKLVEKYSTQVENFLAACGNGTADASARAAFLLINDLAVVLLRDEVARVLGVDPLSRQGLRRWGNTVMEIYRGGAFAVPDETVGGRNERTD